MPPGTGRSQKIVQPTSPPRVGLQPPFWIKPVAVALLVHLALMAGYLLAFGGDLSALLCADREKIGRWPFEVVRVGFPIGYDGQFYYVLARNPWRSTTAFIDAPALRHARVLFPVLGWLASGGGDPERLLWALPLLNLACIALLAWLGAVWARHHGRNPMWGCLLPIVVNAGTPALRDLTDPLASVAVTGLLVSWLLGRGAWVVSAWAMAAVLSREQNAIVIGIVFTEALLQRRWRVCACLSAVLAAWLAFLVLLHDVYGAWPIYSENMSTPFKGIIYRLNHIKGGTGSRGLPIHAIPIAELLLQIGLCLAMIFYRPQRPVLLVALAGAALAIMGGIPLYDTAHAYMRVFAWMPVGIWLWSIQSGRAWPVWLLSPTLAMPCFAVVQVWNR